MGTFSQKKGLKPFLAQYTPTISAESYDQIIHDIALMDLPVVFALDRAGIVGEDGETHQGVFDISFLRIIPNMHLIAPFNETSFIKALEFTANFDTNQYPSDIQEEHLLVIILMFQIISW